MVLAVLIIASFPQVVAGFETFFYHDFSSFGYPLALYFRESFWRGALPLWNPLSYCGLPFLAQWNTMTLYPFSLFYLLLPLSWSLGMFNLAHLFLAGLGMYFLAFRWTENRLAASVGGIIFAFNGLTWHALMWPNNIAALGWMPWVVLATHRAWREGGRQIIYAGLAGAMQMLTGAPEVIIITWSCLGLWCLFDFWPGAPGRLRIMWRAARVVCLVAGLSAAQLLPFMDLLAHSQRGAAFGDAKWSMPTDGWANYLVPLFHCSPGQQGVFAQHDQYWTTSYYLGVGAVAMALLAIWRARDWRTWLPAGLAVFAVTVAMGDAGPVYGLLKRAVPLGFMRFPIKFVILATFVIPLLAAQGVGRLQTRPEREWPAECKIMLRLMLILLGALAAIAGWEWLVPLPGDPRAVILKSALLRALFLGLIVGCLAILRGVAQPKLQRLLRVCLLMLFWFDVFTLGPTLTPTVTRARGVYEPGLIRQYEIQQGKKWDTQLRFGESRAFETLSSINKILYQAVDDTADDVLGRRLSLFANFNLYDQVPKFDGFYSLNMRAVQELTVRVYLSTNDLPGLKDFLGIAYVNHPTNAVDWVYRSTFLPMITAGQEPEFADDTAALAGVTADDFDPVRSVYLPAEAGAYLTARRARAKIISRQFTEHRLSAEVEAAAPALVVVAQAFYHPWKAYVDGKPARLWRANYAYQALEVPAGRHQVLLVYQDTGFDIGVVISLGAIAACLLAWFRGRRDPLPFG